MDSEILKLLNERAKVALKINKVKEQNKESYYSPQREKTIFEKLSKMNKGPFPNESVISIFKEIISASRSVGRPLKIAYWGPEATYTHLAAMMRFGSSVKYIPISSLSDIFIEVERKRCDYGVVPIENSTEGVVNYTLDIFVDSELKICSEIMLKISHNLLNTAKSIKEIKKCMGIPNLFLNQEDG